MTTLTKASAQWASRPDDEQFLSLPDMQSHFDGEREHSRSVAVASKAITTDDILHVEEAAEGGIGHENR